MEPRCGWDTAKIQLAQHLRCARIRTSRSAYPSSYSSQQPREECSILTITIIILLRSQVSPGENPLPEVAPLENGRVMTRTREAWLQRPCTNHFCGTPSDLAGFGKLPREVVRSLGTPVPPPRKGAQLRPAPRAVHSDPPSWRNSVCMNLVTYSASAQKSKKILYSVLRPMYCNHENTNSTPPRSRFTIDKLFTSLNTLNPHSS